MTDDDIPLTGTTLIVGPLRAGKTRMTAAVLKRWLDEYGPSGVVVIDTAPEIESDEGLIGGRLDRFIDVPSAVFYGAVATSGPRAEGSSSEESRRIAKENAERARMLIESAPPTPRAVFVNDVTLAFQYDPSAVDDIATYWQDAECVVINAYEGSAFDKDDPISKNERRALARLKQFADRVIDLG